MKHFDGILTNVHDVSAYSQDDSNFHEREKGTIQNMQLKTKKAFKKLARGQKMKHFDDTLTSVHEYMPLRVFCFFPR